MELGYGEVECKIHKVTDDILVDANIHFRKILVSGNNNTSGSYVITNSRVSNLISERLKT